MGGGNWPAGSGEDFFEWFLPYMGVAAILVMWSRSREQTFVPPTHGCSTQNFAFIGQAVSEKKIFEIVDRRRTDDGAWPSYKLTLWAFGSGELKIGVYMQNHLYKSY